eukprot:914774-Prymnesium_polylepis.2
MGGDKEQGRGGLHAHGRDVADDGDDAERHQPARLRELAEEEHLHHRAADRVHHQDDAQLPRAPAKRLFQVEREHRDQHARRLLEAHVGDAQQRELDALARRPRVGVALRRQGFRAGLVVGLGLLLHLELAARRQEEDQEERAERREAEADEEGRAVAARKLGEEAAHSAARTRSPSA